MQLLRQKRFGNQCCRIAADSLQAVDDVVVVVVVVVVEVVADATHTFTECHGVAVAFIFALHSKVFT